MTTDGTSIRMGGRLAENLIISLINKGDSRSTTFLKSLHKTLSIEYPFDPEGRAFCALPAGSECGKTDIKLYNGGVLIANIQIKKGPQRFLRKSETLFDSRKTGNQIHGGGVDSFTSYLEFSDLASDMFYFLCRRSIGFDRYSVVNQKKLVEEIDSKKYAIGEFVVKGTMEEHIPDVHVIVNTQRDKPRLQSYTVINTTTFVDWLMDGPVEIVKGGLHIGRLRLQRKGGDSGRKSANRVQMCFSIPELNSASKDGVLKTSFVRT